MPLVTSKQLLQNAQREGYAVPAFNIENMEMAMAVIEIARELQSPVILQTTPSTVKYAGMQMYSALASVLAGSVDVPVVLHLDHGESFVSAVNAIREGYTSVMIDGSHYSFEENIAVTKKVVDVGKACGITVEGELGRVGGKEDDLDSGDSNKNTDPEQALEFVKQTDVDSLAIAIGTAHGIYKGIPQIDMNCLQRVRKLVDIPLVLHGTTGVDSATVTQCVKAGMCKVNYATELRIAYSDGIKEILENDRTVYDPKVYGRAGLAKVKAVVEKNIRLCLSAGKG